jgi:hypothetical protein
LGRGPGPGVACGAGGETDVMLVGGLVRGWGPGFRRTEAWAGSRVARAER